MVVFPVRRAPATTTFPPPMSRAARRSTSSARPIIALVGIGASVGKSSALPVRLLLITQYHTACPALPQAQLRRVRRPVLALGLLDAADVGPRLGERDRGDLEVAVLAPRGLDPAVDVALAGVVGGD